MPPSQVWRQKAGFQRWGSGPTGTTPTHPAEGPPRRPRFGVFRADGAGGHIYRGLKPVQLEPPASRNALAEAPNSDYPDGHNVPSVYVAFPVTARLQRTMANGAGRRWHQPEQRSLWACPLGPRLPGGVRSGPPPPGPCRPTWRWSVERARFDYASARASRTDGAADGAAANCASTLIVARRWWRACKPAWVRLEPC